MTTGVRLTWRQGHSVVVWLLVPFIICSCHRRESPRFYRFDDNLDQATAVRLPPADKVGGGFSLDFDDPNADKWQTGKENSECTVRHGALLFETHGYDTITSPDNLKIRTAEADSISIRMRVTGAPAVGLYWRFPSDGEFSPGNKFLIHLPGTGDWQTYNIKTLSLRGWAGKNKSVRQLRLTVGHKARVEIDFVRVVGKKSVFSQQPVGVTRYNVTDGKSRRIRPCLFTRTPSEIQYRVAVPKNAYFSFGLGMVDSSPPVEFSVLARQGGSAKTLFACEIDQNKTWLDAKLDLAHYANRAVDIVFKTDSKTPGNVALWSNPILYQGTAGGVGSSSPRERRSHSHNFNVVFYLIDALRADHLAMHGYQRETAPAIKGLAKEGVRFERCFAQDTWTKASLSSVFAGTTTWLHGVKREGDVIPDSLVLLAEILRDCGYATGCVTENQYVGPITGLDRGFSRYESGVRYKSHDRFETHTFPRAAEFLEQHKDRNFFLYVHTVEPHYPYKPPKRFRELFVPPGTEATDVDLYDGEIARADDNLRRFISYLKDLGLHDNTLLIVTADHGEAFGEHGGQVGHGGIPYNELIHVPLIMHLPREIPAGKVVEQNVQLIDIGPTILDLLRLPSNEQFEGLSLLSLLAGEPSADFNERPIYSRGRYTGPTSLIRGGWKLLKTDERIRLYNIQDDYSETNDLAGEKRTLVRSLQEELSSYVKSRQTLAPQMRKRAKETSVEVDQSIIDDLKGLGYLK